MQKNERIRAECLVLAQAFELLWVYFLQSDGQLYGEQSREAAGQFLASLKEVAEFDPSVTDAETLGADKNTDIDDIIRRLDRWSRGSCEFPYEDPLQNRVMIWVYITSVIRQLVDQLKLTKYPPTFFSFEEDQFSATKVRWKGHLPQTALMKDPSKLVALASDADSIAVVGDIRRSQDLMTYSASSVDFSRRMVEFISVTRDLVQKHHGFFDKFTGDGFLAYFNEEICRSGGLDFIDCFLNFTHEIRTFAREHFAEWSLSVKKLPAADIGLGIGADIGCVAFHDLNHHLVAVGDAIVWASRMASEADAAEVIVNNLLFSRLRDRAHISFSDRPSRTKAGEEFLARVLTFEPSFVPVDPPPSSSSDSNTALHTTIMSPTAATTRKPRRIPSR